MRNSTENKVKLVLIRHGATESNLKHSYLGKADEGLSQVGIFKLNENKNSGIYPQVDRLYTSPMKRCIQTADIIYPGIKKCVIREWEEIDFGIFEGKDYKELCHTKEYQKWIDSNGELPFPGGESREAFIKRCEAGFVRMVSDMKKKESLLSVGIVVHGGTIMALLSSFFNGEYFSYQVKNGEGYVCYRLDSGQIIDLKRI